MQKTIDKNTYSITIWYNPRIKQYYYKLLKSMYFEKPGYINGEGHELILVIEIYRDLVKKYEMPIYLKILRAFINFLQKVDNRFSKKYLF